MNWSTRRALRYLLLMLTLGFIAWVNYYVWLPDLISGRETVLASVESQAGEQFKIVQFWGPDFYITQLEHVGLDGAMNVAIIDWDDYKQWSCSLVLTEAEKKLAISFPSERQVFEYRWDLGYFIVPPGREEFPYTHRAKGYRRR